MAASFKVYKNRAFTRPISLAGVPVAEVSQKVADFKVWLEQQDGVVEGQPEVDAIWFYLKNHVVSQIGLRVTPDEPLGEFEYFVEDYHRTMQVKALRMFYYLLLICTREARHLKNCSSMVPKAKSMYGDSCGKFLNVVCGLSEHNAVAKLSSNPPDATLGNYTAMLEWVFNTGSWNGGYGGKEWGKVAKILRQFVHGEITAEMMLDTGFTLCHNNGPIFNKGMLFNSCNKSSIEKILDVQRAGQIPELVLDKASSFVSAEMQSYLTQATTVLGSGWYGEYVDWYSVAANGALGYYGGEKTKQLAKHGMSPKASEIQKQEAAALLKKAVAQQEAAEKAAKAKARLHKGSIEIMPGLWVKKLTRAQL